MRQIIKREFIMKGLHCANCAAKIEKGIQDISGIHSASLDFVGKRLVLEYENVANGERILGDVKNIINKIEQGVEIVEKKLAHKEELEENNTIKLEIFKLIGALVIYVAAIMFKSSEVIRLSLFIAAYLLAGWQVISVH